MGKHGKRCSVGGCSVSNTDVNKHGSEGNKYSVFSWPSDPVMAAKWDKFVGLSRKDWSDPERRPSRSGSFVCETHFIEASFDNLGPYQAGFAERLRLRRDAVPSVRQAEAECAEENAPSGTARKLEVSRVSYFVTPFIIIYRGILNRYKSLSNENLRCVTVSCCFFRCDRSGGNHLAMTSVVITRLQRYST